VNPRDDWAELIARLEIELQHRQQHVKSGVGGETAWEDMRRRLHRMARLLAAPDDVDDVVQTVLLKLQSVESLRRLRAARSPEGYATVIVRNAAVDAVRRRPTVVAATDRLKNQPGRGPRPDEMLDRRTRAAAVREVVDELAESDRLLLTLRFWEDLSIVEIARRFEMPYSTIAVRMFRLLRRLRERLQSHNSGDIGEVLI